MPLLATAGAASVRGFRPYSTEAVAGFIAATGGTITTSGNYKIHTFTSSGTFTVTVAPSGKFLDFIVVGGGGSRRGGGGGYVYKSGQTTSPGSYSVVVGEPTTGAATRAGDSSFASVVGLGGGNGFTVNNGQDGGSGAGGDSGGSYSGGVGLQPTSASGGFGNAGASSTFSTAGGGGGAGSAASGSTGGSGRVSDIDGVTVYSAGGNGTGSNSGAANTGNGGDRDGDGGSGVVVIRYLYQ
jgi:hypothetical protein